MDTQNDSTTLPSLLTILRRFVDDPQMPMNLAADLDQVITEYEAGLANSDLLAHKSTATLSRFAAVAFDPACSRCQAARHICPGCGTSTQHDVIACDACVSSVEDARERATQSRDDYHAGLRARMRAAETPWPADQCVVCGCLLPEGEDSGRCDDHKQDPPSISSECSCGHVHNGPCGSCICGHSIDETTLDV